MRSPDALSNRQKDILDYIEDFVQDHGYPPAIRQIQEKLDISSTSVVAYNLKALESKGMIKREGKVSRGITMSDATPMKWEPAAWRAGAAAWRDHRRLAAARPRRDRRRVG